MTGHVNGLPVEEVLPALMTSGGAVLVFLTGLGTRLRTTRRHAPGRSDDLSVDDSA